MNNNFGRNVILWLFALVLLVVLFQLFQGRSVTQSPQQAVAYSEFVSDVRGGSVREVTIKGNYVTGEYNNGTPFSVYVPDGSNVVQTLESSGVRIKAEPDDSNQPGFLNILIGWLPMIIIIAVWFYFMRQMQGGGKAMGFGKSRAKMLTEKTGRVTFDDVAGIDEAKQELQEVVEFLKDPQKFTRLGGKIPKGVLLVGPPGTGKTLLARSIAGEANVPFFTISGSDFVEMFVGVGASRVRDMFEQGKKHAPCIIFIDEIDAVGRSRGAGYGGGNDEREQTLNQLLVEMDGFESNEGVILIAATNRADVLDPALMRPGRFDRQVVVPNPDVAGREKILQVHMRKVPLASDVNARVVARATPGFSGADLANLTNEAALLAARAGKRLVSMADFEAAKDKVLMGAERRSMVMTEDEKKLTAYHEGGHALVTLHQPASDPIHKATIIPRGRALGLVMRLPEGDKLSMRMDQAKADLVVAMGGRVAEELIFGDDKVTNGAMGDIRMATNLARKMVTEWGMSEKLGMIDYGTGDDGNPFAQKQFSDETQKAVDAEVKTLVDSAYQEAHRILTENMDDLHKIASALLEYESLSGDEIQKLLRGESINRDEDDEGGAEPQTPGRRTSVPTRNKARNRGEEPDAGGGITPDPQPS